ncbi:MAG: hypothetical protein AMXMBFR44_2510 [Candidatus Campbellbacteria bacterium]
MLEWIMQVAQSHPFIVMPIVLFAAAVVVLVLIAFGYDLTRPYRDRKKGESIPYKKAVVALFALSILSGCAKEMTAEERAFVASMEDRIVAAQPDTMILTWNNNLGRIVRVEVLGEKDERSRMQVHVEWPDGTHTWYAPRALARTTKRIADGSSSTEMTGVLLEWWLQSSLQRDTPQPPARSGPTP